MKEILTVILIVLGICGIIATAVSFILMIVNLVKIKRLDKEIEEARLLEAFYENVLRDVPKEVEKAIKQDLN